MSGRQFGFLAGVLLAWIWAETGFLQVLAAVVAGLIGAAVAHVVAGDADLAELIDRVSGRR